MTTVDFLYGALRLTFLSVEDGRRLGAGLMLWLTQIKNTLFLVQTLTIIYICLPQEMHHIPPQTRQQRIMNVMHVTLNFIVVEGNHYFWLSNKQKVFKSVGTTQSKVIRVHPESLWSLALSKVLLSHSFPTAAVSCSYLNTIHDTLPIQNRRQRAHSGCALSWLQIRVCVITLFSYEKHMTMNCTIG